MFLLPLMSRRGLKYPRSCLALAISLFTKTSFVELSMVGVAYDFTASFVFKVNNPKSIPLQRSNVSGGSLLCEFNMNTIPASTTLLMDKLNPKTMEWHDSLLKLMSASNSRGAGVKDETSSESTLMKPQAPVPSSMGDLLVVDNAKPHRSCRFNESLSTISESQTSADSSLDEVDLDVLLLEEEVDHPDMKNHRFHHSFPVSRTRQRRQQRRNQQVRRSITNTRNRAEKMAEIMAQWGSLSDSTMDYLHNCFDEMLLEESSRTESALGNVSKPSRRRSIEHGTFSFDMELSVESVV